MTQITITRLPIRVLASASNGWKSLAVWVQGGGIQPGFEAELDFDGKTYPSNPSTAPVLRAPGRIAARTIISAGTPGTLLYP